MTTETTQVIEMTEHEPRLLASEAVPYEVGVALYQRYRRHVTVEFPSPVTDNQWCITPGGWAGYLPILPGWAIALKPKVPLGNLFRMLEYAYRLDFKILPGVYHSQTLDDFFEVLAGILARRVLQRGRRGYYRTYIARDRQLGYVRGRLDVPRMMRRPANVNLWCSYTEHTADVDDNQILAWTLQAIGRSGLCSERVRPLVRRAFHDLQGLVSLTPVSPSDCTNRTYNRLNDDYAPMHLLSRFFLEHTGPHHAIGSTPMLPFLIDMDRLFEQFVAEWLRTNLPTGHQVKAQEQVTAGEGAEVEFKIDLLLYAPESTQPWCVLDTKYKWPNRVSNDDISQVVTYAEAKDCTEAFLVFPVQIVHPLNVRIGRIRVRSLVFDLHQDSESAGRLLMSQLGLPLAAA